MVEKMKILHITGPKYDIDRAMKQYLGKYEIHFENAMAVLSSSGNVRPFVETNIYKEYYQKGRDLLKYLETVEGNKQKRVTVPQYREMSVAAAREIIRDACGHTENYLKRKKEIGEDDQRLSHFMEHIEPYRKLDFEFHKMLDFRFIKFRLGRIPVDYYHKLEKYIDNTAYTLFYQCHSDENYVWGAYFVPYAHAEEMDAIFLSFHFERVHVESNFQGTPEAAYAEAVESLRQNEIENKELNEKMYHMLQWGQVEIQSAYRILEEYCENFEIRKLAACTKPKSYREEYYILYGWMSERDAQSLAEEIRDDENINCIEEAMDENLSTNPPTKLRNPKILKPFEMFVEMYGLPAYNEMDPTWFIALTYTLMFGIMFGDVGQGIFLVAGGYLLYRFKGSRLAGIISIAGLWSTFFGFMYGSLFGFEEILHPVWMRPMDNIMDTLIMAIAFGGILIIIAMALNIINAIRAKEYGRLMFGQSGIAGLICYGFAITCIALFMNGQALPAGIIIGIMAGLPLLAILLQEPLTHLVEKKEKIFPEGSKMMFLVEALVECFDVVLSYATNTISFVRVGAFALSHAGMMGVVLTLAGMEKGTPNWMVVILGNILVTGLEGLVVGIQVLRLEYYEMFSRFYKGIGKPFTAFHSKAGMPKH